MQHVLAGLTGEGRDRHAPRPLARDAPVRPVGEHVVDALLAPGRCPLHALDRLQRLRPQGAAAGRGGFAIHGDEPLRRGQEDHRVVAAPAVRIAVAELRAMPEPGALVQRFLDLRVGGPDLQAGEQQHVVGVVAARADRGVDVQAVADAGRVIVRAVAGRGVDDAGAGLERDVVGEHADRRAVVERVLERQPIEHLALHHDDRIAERLAGGLADRPGQLGGEDHDPSVEFVGAVVEVGMEGDRQVGRDGPGRRRPDQDRRLAAGERRDARREIPSGRRRQGELDVDRRRGVVLVLDLGLGQRGAAVRAPVHRLLALVDEALLDEPPQGADDRSLVAVVHREVGLVPVAEDAEPLEVDAHLVDEAGGVGAAGAAEVGDAHPGLLRAQLAVDLQLDGQAVAVPARHVGRVEPGHRPRLDDEVLEDLVEGGADVDVAVGVRRTVVQDEARGAPPGLTDARVEAVRLPARQDLRLGRRQVGAHRKVGARQVDGVFPLGHGSPHCTRAGEPDPAAGRSRAAAGS